jgi:hypothetical protein
VAWPSTLRINGWTGVRAAAGPLSRDAKRWAISPTLRRVPSFLRPIPPADPRDWRHPQVGWGLILAENDAVPPADKARAADAPEPIRRLLADRLGAPVFRYRPELALTHLRRYLPNGAYDDVPISGSPMGVGEHALPRYLLIYGSPAEVPWSLQFQLNASASVGRCVGRLSLTGEGLEHYVTALVDEWKGSAAKNDQPVVWSVDLGEEDITSLMRAAIAEPVADRFSEDSDIGSKRVFLDGSDGKATRDALVDTLADRRPTFVLTTSHGLTPASGDDSTRRQVLGAPVDQDGEPLLPEALLSTWEPDGAIWYSHACCSAGGEAPTRFEGLVGGDLETLLLSLAGLGASVARLPEALLGAPKPLRAFVGHVEPTFDWTLEQPDTGHLLTDSTVRALYNNLFLGDPLGFAFRDCHAHVGELLAALDGAIDQLSADNDTRDRALACQLAARDRQSLVILGDPTVALPPLGGT